MTIDLNKIKEPITKLELYKYVQDVDIYRKYLESEISFGKPIKSPLMKDNKPSLGFFIGENNEICFNDFRIGKGDCIRFVQLLFGYTYFEALSQIAIDFNLDKHYIVKNLSKSNLKEFRSNLSREEILSKVTSLRLSKKRRNWLGHDLIFWEEFGITKATLDYFNVEPLDYFFINERIIKADKYCYCFIEYKDGIETYKIYQPFNKNFKWLNNHDESIWQGWEQLPERGSELIITKSLKDVMSLYDVTGIPAVSLQSENVLPKAHVFTQLNGRFDTKYSLYDNDLESEVNWGKIFGDKISSQFGLIEMYIPDQYKTKDFSDLVKKYGRKEAKSILENKMSMPF